MFNKINNASHISEVASLSFNKILTKIFSFSLHGITRISFQNSNFYVPLDSLEVLEFLEHYFLYYIPRDGDVIFDLGAHVGLFAIPIANVVGEKGVVVAVEPSPDNFNLLINNIKMNRCKNVIPIKAAIWFEQSVKKLYVPSSISASLFQRGKISSNFYEVKTVTMIDLIRLVNVRRIDFLKIDIEGAEFYVLTKNNCWLEAVDNIVGELEVDVYGFQGYAKIMDELKKHGFKVSCGKIQINKLYLLSKDINMKLHGNPFTLLYLLWRGISCIGKKTVSIRLFYAFRKR